MTSIWYEILPVTLELNQVVMLRRREDGEAPSWLVKHHSGMHPNDAVIEHLKLFFGDLFEPQASIVHSTSWRYCHRIERLIVTYLVVLPQQTWIRCWAASDRIIAQRVGKIEQAHGDNLHPPERIEVSTIVTGEPQNWSKVSFDRSEQRAKAWGRSKAGMWRDCLRMWKIKASSGNDASPQQTSSLLAISFWCSYTVLKTKSRGKPSPTREDVGRLQP